MDGSPAPAPPEVADRDLRLARATLIVNRMLAIGLVSAVAGVVVGGIGSRIVMRISALAAQDWAQGRLTDAGARVGEITFGGTLALILFGGLGAAVMGTALVAAGTELFPGRSWLRSLLGVALFVSLAGPLVIDPANVDFIILEPVVLNVALFGGLAALFGAVTLPAVTRVERWIGQQLRIRLQNWGLPAVLAVLGVVLAVSTARAFTSRDFCGCADPPLLTAGLLGIAFAATGALWGRRILSENGRWPTMLAIGVMSLLAAMFIGSARLIDHIGTLI